MQVSKRKISWGPTKFEDKKVYLTNFYYSLKFCLTFDIISYLKKDTWCTVPLTAPSQ